MNGSRRRSGSLLTIRITDFQRNSRPTPPTESSMDVVLINEINSSERRRRRRQRQRRHQSEMNTVMSPVGDVIDLTSAPEDDRIPVVDLTQNSQDNDINPADLRNQVSTRSTCERSRSRSPPSRRRCLEDATCPVCFEILSDIISRGESLMSTLCGHVFCATCVRRVIRSSTNKFCPTCRTPLSSRNVHKIFFNV